MYYWTPNAQIASQARSRLLNWYVRDSCSTSRFEYICQGSLVSLLVREGRVEDRSGKSGEQKKERACRTFRPPKGFPFTETAKLPNLLSDYGRLESNYVSKTCAIGMVCYLAPITITDCSVSGAKWEGASQNCPRSANTAG